MPMARTFYQAGYNVIIPRMPGHGKAGEWDRNNPPPLPTDGNTYKKFALDWFRQAQSFGEKVVVGGLSGGGTLAAWLALEKAEQIDRALLFAAYLSNSSRVVDLFVKNFNTYFEWQPPDELEIGYKGFMVQNLRVFLDLGREVLQRSKSTSAPPTFVVSTEADMAVRNSDHRALVENLLKRQPKTWYYSFDRALNIPHTMLTKAEGNPWENLLNVMAKAFVQSDLTWAEVEDIAYRMVLEGKTFNQVVADLNLGSKVSPDMPAFMTMIDKREIFIKRNPTWGNE